MSLQCALSSDHIVGYTVCCNFRLTCLVLQLYLNKLHCLDSFVCSCNEFEADSTYISFVLYKNKLYVDCMYMTGIT